jgi:hypothetical protein
VKEIPELKMAMISVIIASLRANQIDKIEISGIKNWQISEMIIVDAIFHKGTCFQSSYSPSLRHQ